MSYKENPIYRCNVCGEIYTLSEAEDDMSCPNCGKENFDEVVICDECGKAFSSEYEYRFGGLCQDCFELEATFPNQAIEYGGERTEEVEINGLWAKTFTASEIDEILSAAFTQLPDNRKRQYEMDFCSDDPQDFVDWSRERSGV